MTIGSHGVEERPVGNEEEDEGAYDALGRTQGKHLFVEEKVVVARSVELRVAQREVLV